jgi:CRP-like cAMP-binding protein
VSDEEAIRALAAVPLFAELPAELLRRVAARTAVRRLAPGALLFRKGDPARGFYLVLEGRVEIYRADADGREQVLHVEGPGRPVAELPLFDGGPYPASGRAAGECRVLFLPRDDFRWLYSHHPEVADVVIQELGRRLRRMVGLVEAVSLKDVRGRVAGWLAEEAGRRGGLEDGATFTLPVSQEALARALATTRESVARALSGLRKEGVLGGAGRRIEILDAGALRAAASGASRAP